MILQATPAEIKALLAAATQQFPALEKVKALSLEVDHCDLTIKTPVLGDVEVRVVVRTESG